MDLDAIIKSYINEMELRAYPHDIVNRRQFTYKQFLETSDEPVFNETTVMQFYNDNLFLRPQSICLLHSDMLSLIHFMEVKKLVDPDLFIILDRKTEEHSL